MNYLNFFIFFVVQLFAVHAVGFSNGEFSDEKNKFNFTVVKKDKYSVLDKRCDPVDWGNIKGHSDSVFSDKKTEYTRLSRLIKSKTDIPSGYQRYVHFGNGWVVSFDAGEISQSTWFYSDDGETIIRFFDKAFDKFYMVDERLYGIYSYSHLFESTASLYSIGINKKISVSEVFKVDFSPIAYSEKLINNSFLVVTHDRIINLKMDGQFNEVNRIKGLGNFRPVWIDESNGVYQIGLGSGYLEINGKQERWYIKSTCL